MKCVALRKESVDRNLHWYISPAFSCWSLSARRAWIEIFGGASAKLLVAVALRKESVDRNTKGQANKKVSRLSLSARRAWIEILAYPDMIICTNGRSPQGERG